MHLAAPFKCHFHFHIMEMIDFWLGFSVVFTDVELDYFVDINVICVNTSPVLSLLFYA